MFKDVTDSVRESENEDEKKLVSEEAIEVASRSVRNGLVRSLAVYLFATTGDESDTHKKIRTFINALIANKDIDADMAESLERYYIDLRSLQFAVDPSCSTPPCEESYSLWYTIVNSLFDEGYNATYFLSDANKKKLTDYEVEIMTNYSDAAAAYWKARDEMVRHYNKVLREVANRTLLKYGTTLTQIAPTWYKSVIRAAGLKPEVKAEDS